MDPFSRIISGKKFWYAHQEHLYQRLIRIGWGRRKVVLTSYVVMLGCGLMAIIMNMVNTIDIQLMLMGLILLMLCGITLLVHLLEANKNRENHGHDRHRQLIAVTQSLDRISTRSDLDSSFHSRRVLAEV